MTANASASDMKAICENIVREFEKSGFVDTAMKSVGGISVRQANNWLRRGREMLATGEEPQDERHAVMLWFADQIEVTAGKVESRHLSNIETHSADDWKASTWLLEMRDRRKYGQKIVVSVKEEISNFLDRLEQRLPPEVFEAVLRAALETGDDREAEPVTVQITSGDAQD